MVEEIWMPIPGFWDYAASSEGRIRNGRLGHVLKGTVTKKGFVQICIRGRRGRTTGFVNRLVAAAFLGPPPTESAIAKHLNGNRLDNRPSNLEYVSRSARMGATPFPCGEQNPKSKLTAHKVLEMRQLRRDGMKLDELASQFRVTASAVSRVVNRRDWRHIP